MPLCGQYKLAGVDVWVWNITETVDELLGLVPESCASYALRVFKSDKRCSEWLAVRAILASEFGDSVAIVYDDAGKPMLDGVCGSVTISHTDGYAVVAYSRDVDVGVDVERVSRNVVALAGRFMAAEILDKAAPDKRNFVALVHWCAKEALYKIVGNLGGNFKDNISVAIFEPEESGCVQVTLAGLCSPKGDSFVADYFVLDGLLVMLCRNAIDCA